MHYVDEGDGDPVLLLHGEPTWSYLYRKLIPPLRRGRARRRARLLRLRRSDKPVDRDWYSFDSHYAVDRAARSRSSTCAS